MKQEKTPSTIISIHFGHNATVALMQDGKITDCISEERFNRIKNSTGFPTLALEYIKSKTSSPVDYYVFTQKYPWGYSFLKNNGFKTLPYGGNVGTAPSIPIRLRLSPSWFYKRIKDEMLSGIEKIEKNTDLKTEMEDYFSNLLQVPKNKILYVDHHLTHALSTKLFEKNQEPRLIFTLDGEGDGLCATVTESKNGKDITLSKTSKAFSLGYLYREVTAFLGMKPDEHEFKVMGLAPYAKKEHVEKLLPIFQKILWLNKNDEFESDIPMPTIQYYLMEHLGYKRFDNIAGAIQMFTENITIDWISRWIQKTGIRNISISGGVFMNVKMNQKISEIAEVDSLTIVPSAGDESTVFGGCIAGYQKFCSEKNIEPTIQPLKDLYLGNSYTDEDIEKFLNKNNYSKIYSVTKPENIEKDIAKLLSENKVVARFSGRMEFGARALGNRSILANPHSYENVRIINEMIKNRDFWMPFATSLIEEDTARYLHNHKNVSGNFMAITFNTTLDAQEDLSGAIHPYDKTSRPQIVTQTSNPSYHTLISEYKKLTGSGGILNTSFNLHGEPNVESPKDAMHTFEKSGIVYLALGPYLISKNK